MIRAATILTLFILLASVCVGQNAAVAQVVEAAPVQAAETQRPQELAFHQLAPDARRLLVEEIKIELATEEQNRWVAFTQQVETWLRIGSGLVAVIGAVLAILGWRGLAGLRQNLQKDLIEFIRSDPQFQVALQGQLSAVSQNAASVALEKGRREISLARLEFLARKVVEADSFTNDERDAMRSLLLSVRDDSDITRSEYFRDAAYKVVRSLYGADLDAHIDELEEQFRDIFVNIPPICGQLVDAYGERLLEVDSPSNDLGHRFDLYAGSVRKHKAPPWHLPWRLAALNLHRPDGWSKRVDAILHELSYARDQDKQFVLDMIKRRAERSAEEARTFRQEREREAFMSLLSEYLSKIEAACLPKAKAS